jgi:hypothetical protein
MKYILLLPCLVLFYCFSKEEVEEVEKNIPHSSSSCFLFGISSYESEPYKPDPLVFDYCPAEDVAEYPILEPKPWPVPCERPPDGWIGALLKLSVEELSFGKQGGVRCVTTNQAFLNASGAYSLGCHSEHITVSTVNTFKREVCPWFTVTRLDGWRTLHISVSQNETGKERKMDIGVSIGNSGSGFTIIQSAD